MKKIYTIGELRENVKEWKRSGLSVGFVPTMGFLHEGHMSLIKQASEQNDKAVVSIFVNPMQFGKNEDFDSYPSDFERDCGLCEEYGVDIVFHPDAREMYPEHFSTYVNTDDLTDVLCGKSRPGHFRGVCTVVSKLFNIVDPDRAYFGQKDAQQLAVIKRMTRDLGFGIEIVGCPTVREANGLAKSSRNSYLTGEQKDAASIIYKALCGGRDLLLSGQKQTAVVRNEIEKILLTEPLVEIEYIDILDFETLKDTGVIEDTVLMAVAVHMGSTRLIDNIII